MNGILHTIYSAEFFIGAGSGAVMMKLYQWHHCRHLDKVAPLPGGRRRHMPGVDLPTMGVLLAVLALGYVLFQTQETEGRYRGLADRVTRCQTVFQRNIVDRATITLENDRISVLQREKLTQLDKAAGELVNRQLNPPPNIAGLAINDPRRLVWNEDVTRFYYEQTTALRADIENLRVEQDRLVAERAAHPVPDPSC